ncbi:hypothetical protein BCR34DRAFT_593924 [Clohesyomyces aquaticus]|uniref:REJ domain-containing protein n=1 Tax=Clohesyomyces aquaticus TaxID=1231657 RepID=A0A1Y1YE63_9PLEO|nr:hypothetical protein BCR34DRAFT_593924 [Clohesyomyces aquaticus]
MKASIIIFWVTAASAVVVDKPRDTITASAILATITDSTLSNPTTLVPTTELLSSSKTKKSNSNSKTKTKTKTNTTMNTSTTTTTSSSSTSSPSSKISSSVTLVTFPSFTTITIREFQPIVHFKKKAVSNI